MRAYPDAGFLLALLVQNTKGASRAGEVLQDWNPPFQLNFLHQLQIENFLLPLQKTTTIERQGRWAIMDIDCGETIWPRVYSK
jgi:hypothetical protein